MKFTVGIPAYKARFLRECIESVLNQSYSDFDVIVLNDASPENIHDIIQQFNSPRIAYFENTRNLGAVNVIDTWNKCLSYANGDYFVLLGDDDVMDREYLRKFSWLIENHPECQVFHCRTLIIDEASCPIGITESRPSFESVYDLVLARISGARVSFISDHVYKTTSLKARGGFAKLPLAWASDDISTYEAAVHAGIVHTDQPLLSYRRTAFTISSTGNAIHKLDAIRMERDWLLRFVETVPEDPVARLVRESIRQRIDRYIAKKRIDTLSYAIEKGGMKAITWMLFEKKAGQVSFTDAFLSIVAYLRTVWVNKRFSTNG